MIRTAVFFLSVFWIGLAAPLSACQVPVFRYALERWWPDFYTLTVVHSGNLTPELEGMLEPYVDSSELANLEVELVNLKEADGDTLARFRQFGKVGGPPVLVLHYPAAPIDEPAVFSAPFTKVNLDRIVDSPARQQIAARILKGDSAVWVVLDDGSAEAGDDFNRLDSGLKELAGYMELPEGVITPDEADELMESARAGNPPPPGFDAENILNYGVPLRLGFSVVRVDREAAEEDVFVRILLASDPDLDPTKGAVAIPIFGRGRMLQGLPIKSLIDDDILPDACYYICGACSCQVKGQNPGLDLLMKVDWESALEGHTVIVEKELPPLSGAGDIADPPLQNPTAEEPPPAPNPDPAHSETEVAAATSNPILSWLFAALAGAVLVIGTASFLILRKNKN